MPKEKSFSSIGPRRGRASPVNSLAGGREPGSPINRSIQNEGVFGETKVEKEFKPCAKKRPEVKDGGGEARIAFRRVGREAPNPLRSLVEGKGRFAGANWGECIRKPQKFSRSVVAYWG